MKKYTYIAVLALFIVSSACSSKKKVAQQNNPKKESAEAAKPLQVCPEEWIENRMPSTEISLTPSTVANQYFILNGVRREMSEFDMDWVKKNCDLKAPKVIH